MTHKIPARVSDSRIRIFATMLGFASGLPYALLIGSLTAWLSNASISFSAIATLSWIGLIYSFKFIWAPAFDWLVPPFANTVGRRRVWMGLCQVVISACLFGITLFDPRVNLVGFSLFAVVATFASASQDIVVDAWRIEAAQDGKQLDRLTVCYQLGYRLAAIIGGAVALLLADLWALAHDAAAGWPAIYRVMAFLMGCAVFASLAAPEPLIMPSTPSTPSSSAVSDPQLTQLRRYAVLPVLVSWVVAGASLLGFMLYTLCNSNVNAAEFRDAATPWILLLTIGIPICISFWLARKPGALNGPSTSCTLVDTLYEHILAPLSDIVRRYRLWSLPILALALTYRIADSIWGSFAYPFYLTILSHSNSDVAIASKMVGILMTLTGIALAGVALAWIGRMPALIVGAVIAATTNLLYADLARGGAGIDGFLHATGVGTLLDWGLRGFVETIQEMGITIFDGVTLGDPLTRLTAVIAMENIAGGFASGVHIAWLSSIVNKCYAVVQYALLSSLAMLIGVIFRPRIGSFVDELKDQGLSAQAERFAEVFVFSAWIGLVAVVLAALEWWRQNRCSITESL